MTRSTANMAPAPSKLKDPLYHEILEAASVGSLNPPADIMDFNEGAFEQAASAAHARWGSASPENLNLLLQFYGFAEE